MTTSTKKSKDEQENAQKARYALAEQGIPWSQYAYLDWASRGELEVMRFFWDGGMPVDARTGDMKSILHIAARSGYLNLLKEAMRHGANPNAQNNVGETPLVEAVEAGRGHIVRELIGRNADLNIQTATNGFGGCTALFFAALYGRAGIARQLLNAGAWVDLANRDGMTPLMAASYHGHPEVLSLLINNGAELTRVDQQGANALDYALAEQGPGNKEAQRILIEAGLRPSEPKKLFSGGGSGAGYCRVTWRIEQGEK